MQQALMQFGGLSPSARDLGGQSPLRNFLGSKEHLDWVEIDQDAAKIRNVQDYTHTKN